MKTLALFYSKCILESLSLSQMQISNLPHQHDRDHKQVVQSLPVFALHFYLSPSSFLPPSPPSLLHSSRFSSSICLAVQFVEPLHCGPAYESSAPRCQTTRRNTSTQHSIKEGRKKERGDGAFLVPQ